MMVLIEQLAGILSDRVVPMSDECLAAARIAAILDERCIPFEREYRLEQTTDRVDFYLPRSGIVIEVKVAKRWSRKKVFRQCERYCAHPMVGGLLLATGRAQQLPSTIMGKPVRVHYLAEGML